MIKKRSSYGLLIACGLVMGLLLNGCSLAPQYTRPQSPVSNSWPTQSVGSENPNQGRDLNTMNWRDFVLDERLRAMVEQALLNNRDLKQALLNIEAVRAQYRITRSSELPHFGVNAQGGRTRTSGYQTPTGNPLITDNYQVSLGMSAFEIDLFGKLRNLSEAALQEYLATDQAYQAIRISLVSSVIQAYLTRDGAQKRYDITKQTLETRRTSLVLIEQRQKAGAASKLDYHEALGLMEQAEAALEVAKRQVAKADNSLVLLVGKSIKDFPAPSKRKHSLLQDNIACGLPSDLLQRRPDILAAEHRLIAKNANIGAARAAFYPSISLTGFFGTSSDELSNLFNATSGTWQFMPRISLPIFNAGKLEANLELAKIRKDIAIVQYEKTIQVAFREVSDALAARDTLQREEKARADLVASSSESLRLSEARYKNGVDSHLRYLDAQRRSFANQISLLATKTERQIALVNLFKALGGSWDLKNYKSQKKKTN